MSYEHFTMLLITSSEKSTKKKQIGTRDCVGETSERFFSQPYFYISFNFNILFLHIHGFHNNRSYGRFRQTVFFFFLVLWGKHSVSVRDG